MCSGFARRAAPSDRSGDPLSTLQLLARVGRGRDLLTDRAVLLDDEEPGSALDHVFDVGDLVPGDDHEQRWIPPHTFVLLKRDVNLLDAGVVAAFAHNSKRLNRAPEASAHALDLFVARAKESLIRGEPRPPLVIRSDPHLH